MMIFCIVVLAVVVLVALIRKNSVKFHVQFLGARVHLEAKGKGQS